MRNCQEIQKTLREVWSNETRLATHDQHLAVEIQQGLFAGVESSEFQVGSFHAMDNGNGWHDLDNTSASWWPDDTESCDAGTWYADDGDEKEGAASTTETREPHRD